MSEIGQGDEITHYLKAGQYTYLAGEINAIRNEWTTEEQQQYLMLTKKYGDALKKYLKDVL